MTAILQADELVKSFGPFNAVDGANLQIEERSIHALIGPNGAGKTTLFYLLAGYIKPTAGRVRFRGADITGLSPNAVARRGMVCAFQITHVFPRMTVAENVTCAVLARHRGQYRFWAPISAAIRREADELLHSIGLAAVAYQRAGTLSHGDQRVLEVALALATSPSMLLLDEPTAGMSPVETERTVALLRRLAQERALTVLLVEHDVNVVFTISDRVTVLHQGRVLCEGPPAEIRKDPAVIEVYLGAAA